MDDLEVSGGGTHLHVVGMLFVAMDLVDLQPEGLVGRFWHADLFVQYDHDTLRIHLLNQVLYK